jgi:5-methylcytosine-specific restriction endonuclease McrA
MSLDGRVLLLNQTYEPLGTVGVARAMIMLFKNSVTVEEWDGDHVLRTPREEYPVPSVLRRRAYVNVRRRREASGSKRVRIYIRDGFRCQYCGERKNPVELTLDHILPRSRGGNGSAINVVTACFACNQRKGNRTPEEARMPLLTAQSALGTELERVVLCHYAEARPEWRKYIFIERADESSPAIKMKRA